MKFENPIMTISMFEIENVVTEASGTTPAGPQSAATAVEEFVNAQTGTSGITITF